MGTFYTNLLPQSFTLKWKQIVLSKRHKRTNIKIHGVTSQKILILIQPRKAYFGRYIATELEELECDLMEGTEVTQVREEL
jgi:hypothetical protein